MSKLDGRIGLLLLWIFVLSGFSGLIYQSIWTQYLGLFLGHSAYAQSLVLMLFMGGMAIGAWLISRRSASVRRPLLVYAVIELVIGLLGLGFDGMFRGVTGWAYVHVMPGLDGGQLTAFRWLLASLLVLPQCILLGATFPLMSAGYMRLQPDSEGRVLAGLYFSNSIGAAIGALASTYLLLPAVGLPGTVLSAGLINIVVAISVYPLSKREAPAEVKVPGGEGVASAAGRARLALMVLIVAGLTGASSFIYEITWVRMLSLALGTTIHSFELMLASFIAGIAFGGLWLRKRADKMSSPLRVAGWVQIWMGLAAIASMFVYARSFEWVGWMMHVVARTADGYGLYNVASGVISLLVMFPAAFFAGMTLPLLTLALLRQGQGEKAIGQAYAFNTVGAIIGVLAAVHLLMPLLGLKYALLVAAVVDLLLGCLLIARTGMPLTTPWRSPLIRAAVISFAGVLAAIMWVRFDPLVLSSSVYRHGSTSLQKESKVVSFEDGKTATVTLFDVASSDGTVRAIATNGKVDAAMALSAKQIPTSDESTMTLLAAVPLALRDGYDRVGVIGFGSGMTTHTLLTDKRVGSVDTVEIEPAMVQGARLFGERVSNAFNDPRSHIIIDDAKSYFASSPKKYDLIVSEPSNPWVGGTATLFSKEFYEFVPQQLNEGGIFVQWLQLYEITPELVNSVLSGMLDNFGDVNAYLANGGDMILVATPKGSVPPLSGQLFAQPQLRADLARIGVYDLRDLQDTFVMNHDALRHYLRLYPSKQNSDYFPILKLNAPSARFRQIFVDDFVAVTTAPWPMTRRFGGPEARAQLRPASAQSLPLNIGIKTKAAHELAGVLLGTGGGETKYASTIDVSQAEALRGMGSLCTLGKAPARTASMIFSVAMETMPYLSAQDLAPLWGRPDWLKCEVEDPTVATSLAFVAAVAGDRHEDVMHLGNQLLEGKQGATLLANGTAGYYVFGAMQYAAYVTGDQHFSQRLTEERWLQLDPESRSRAALRLLSSLAASGARPVTSKN